MTDQSKRQLFVLAGIALVALVGAGLVAFFAGSLLGEVLEPTPTPPPPTDTPLPPPVITIQGIKSQAKLATVEFATVTEIYNETVPEGWLDDLLGTRERLLMLVYGDVQAGFDLEKLEEENLWSDGARVRSKVMIVCRHRLSGPSPSGIGKQTDEFLLLRVDADDRIASRFEGLA